MRSMIVCFALFAAGALFLPYSASAVGTAVSSDEVAVMWGGCAKYGNAVKVCYGGGACTAGGCGCTMAQKMLDDPSGKTPDAASACVTSVCTTPQTLTGSDCYGG